jgi:predicted TIM-barrel enzyme
MAYSHIGATTTGSQITAVSGSKLKSIVVNTAAASAVLTVYDATLIAGVGGPIPNGAAVIAVVDASIAGTRFYGTSVINGVSVVLSGANADLTIVTE